MADNYKIRLIGELDAETTTSDIKKQLEGIKIKANILEGGFTAESIEKLSEQISNAVDAYQKKSEKSPIRVPIKISKVDGSEAIAVFKNQLSKEINALNIPLLVRTMCIWKLRIPSRAKKRLQLLNKKQMNKRLRP